MKTLVKLGVDFLNMFNVQSYFTLYPELLRSIVDVKAWRRVLKLGVEDKSVYEIHLKTTENNPALAFPFLLFLQIIFSCE